MRNKLRLAVIICLAIAGMAQTVRAREDWMWWFDHKISWKMDEKTTWTLAPDTRFRDDMSEYFYKAIALSHVYSWGYGFSSLAAMQYEESKSSSGWNDTEFIIAGPVHSFDIDNICKVKSQAAFYYRTNDDAEFDHVRPRLFLSRKLGPVEYTISDEIRLDLTGDREHDFYRNRLYLSGTVPVCKRVKFCLGYLRQSDQKGGDWTHSNGVITTFNLSL